MRSKGNVRADEIPFVLVAVFFSPDVDGITGKIKRGCCRISILATLRDVKGRTRIQHFYRYFKPQIVNLEVHCDVIEVSELCGTSKNSKII